MQQVLRIVHRVPTATAAAGRLAQVSVPFALEVDAISEEIVVRGEAPLLDATAVSSAAHFARISSGSSGRDHT